VILLREKLFQLAFSLHQWFEGHAPSSLENMLSLGTSPLKTFFSFFLIEEGFFSLIVSPWSRLW
jgi:hypothetical protein